MSKAQGPTPWAVLCPEHGRVYISEENYQSQMDCPNTTWRCPCGQEAFWDDANYERYLDACEQLESFLNPLKALPPAFVTFKLHVGQVWKLDALHALPMGICWIKEIDQARGKNAEGLLIIGMYRAELTYIYSAGLFTVRSIAEVRNPFRRSELWSIVGRSLGELLEDRWSSQVSYKQNRYLPL